MSGNYVINIGRQLGSGGKEIGEKLAAVSYTHLKVCSYLQNLCR